MIWWILCRLGRHDWQPVFRHHVTRSGELISLVRCRRRDWERTGYCDAERYTVTPEGWRRGGQTR